MKKLACVLIVLLFYLCGCNETPKTNINQITLAAAADFDTMQFDEVPLEICVYSNENYCFTNRNIDFCKAFKLFLEETKLTSPNEDNTDFDGIYISVYQGENLISLSIQENDIIGLNGNKESYYCKGVYQKFKYTFEAFFEENQKYCRFIQSPITMKYEYWIGNGNTHTQMDYATITRQPYLFYDSGIVHFWVQNGTGTLTRQARFFDVEKGLISPYYYGQTDYFGDLVSATDNARVVIYDMFTGKQVCVFDKFEKPIGNCVENIQSAYFSKDGTQIIIKYLNTEFKAETQILDLPNN